LKTTRLLYLYAINHWVLDSRFASGEIPKADGRVARLVRFMGFLLDDAAIRPNGVDTFKALTGAGAMRTTAAPSFVSKSNGGNGTARCAVICTESYDR